MTIASQSRTAGPFTGTGLLVSYPFAFKIFTTSDLLIQQTDTSGVITPWTLGANYTVVLNSDQSVSPGGTITPLVALPAGYVLNVTSAVALTQPAALTNAGGFFPKTIEDALDRLTILIQQALGSISGALRVPEITGVSALPSIATRANQLLSFDSSGNPVAVAPVAGTATALSTSLFSSIGTTLISFLQVGAGAIARTVQSVLREWPSVTDFGAVGDGVTLDTVAFTAAQAASAYVYLPAGKTFLVGAGLNYWQFYGPGVVFENGQHWDANPTPQDGKVLRSYRTRTFGNYENAVGATLSINSANAQTRANTQILGTTTQGMASTYNDRDHVGLYGQAWTYEPDVTSAATTYTSTTLTDTTVGTLAAAGKLIRGMIIDTKHATPLTGRIQSWAGNVITVDAWYTRGTGAAATPANATGAIINPNTKIWGQNTNIFVGGLASNNQAKKGTGHEIGLSCDPTIGTGVWGFDAVTLLGTPERHFSSRGSATYGFYAETGKTYGHVSKTNNRGFSSQDDTLPFEAIQSGASVWSANSDGSTSSNGIKRVGMSAQQCTNAAFVNIGPLPAAYGGMYWISGFNVANGNEANFVLMVRSGAVGTISTSDGSGLAIAFQAVGRQLQIKCGNAGTFQYVAHGFLA